LLAGNGKFILTKYPKFFLSQQLAAGGFETRGGQQSQDTGYQGSPVEPSVTLPLWLQGKSNVRKSEFLSNKFVLPLTT
jgi:hypothetical protein